MKFFYGFLVLALFAAVQAAPAESETVVDSPKEDTAVVVAVEETPEPTKQENKALATINTALQNIIESGILGDAVDFSTKDNVGLLIDTLKQMDPVLHFLEKVRTAHPVLAPAITQYHVFRNAIESNLRILLAPFNLVIGAAAALFRFFG